MDILLLTNVWTGATPFFYHGHSISKGMPAFNNVFLRLLKDSRVSKVHIMVWQPMHKIVIPHEFLEKVEIYPIKNKGNSFFYSICGILNSIIIGVYIIKRNRNIKQIVGFGSLAGITSLIGKLTGIKDFRRVYGTFLINEINDSKWSIFKRHPLEYLTFSTSGKGLLVTNDGTKGNLVFNKIGNKSLPFYFPLNGVDKNIINNIEKPNIVLPTHFITYVARMDPWKRQHLLIDALGFLKEKGISFPKAYIIGSPHNKGYVDLLKNKITEYQLEDKIELIYGLPINQVHYLLYHSQITFSLYHTSNLGNVFIESMQLGTPMIAINDTNSLDLIDKDAFFELKDDSVIEIANAIDVLIKDGQLRSELSNAAIRFANSSIKSWDERTKYEIDLILN